MQNISVVIMCTAVFCSCNSLGTKLNDRVREYHSGGLDLLMLLLVD